jgi:hypothetical protein
MFAALANVTATVRVLRSAACATVDVVMPLATVTVHSAPAASVAVAAVSVSVAPAPEPEVATVNVVLPHLFDTLTPAGDAIVNIGSTNAMLSAASSGLFIVNANETADCANVVVLANTSLLVLRAGATVAVDFVTLTAAMFATFPLFSVTAAVRPLQSDG